MIATLKPWARKSFELIFHAESHWRSGTDYDKRLALISFDNAIEVSISIYLDLNPIQRNNKSYDKKDVQTWLYNYHSKLDFFSQEISRRGLPEYKGKDHIVWLHEQRNELYHGSSGGVPALETVEDIRGTALWVFSVLFEIADVESLLNAELDDSDKAEPVLRNKYAKPEMADLTVLELDPKKMSALAAATFAGKWDEDNQADMQIIRRLSDGF